MIFTKTRRTLAMAVLALTPALAFAESATVVEIVTFKAQAGADASAVTAALDPIAAQMSKYDTLVARSVAEGPAGTWTMVNYWTDRDAMNRINEEALTWPEFAALPGVANLETLQMQQLDIASSVGLETE
ncbi:hypothetical protein C8N43_0112 [Litoreibacter ponti]|uniref:Antibiotic biosynthesis monooxygenase n=1 Tax=Litoreibacter ponti TaxID=1510457 RepID=A0A2T6BHC6_9RHOB|nr:hypothetical protein [Litoreibacter ponti]PTX55473.1 hypothetical protein C8N43_0112 [Litoreibacter ponti]